MTRNPESPDYWSAARHSKTAQPPGNNSTSASEEMSGSRGERRNSKRPARLSKRRPMLNNLKLWAVVTVAVSGTLGFAAVALMLNPGALPNCPAITWSRATASMRLYCAQVAADKQTVDDLLQAIALVSSLPPDNPLRSQIDSSIEEWSQDILRLADQSFQAGNIDDALAAARQIPTETTAHELVQKRIDRWQSIWSKGEETYQKAEEELRLTHWHNAFMAAAELTRLNNTYWATTKYEELTNAMQVAQEESHQVDKARQVYKSGGLENLLAAIKLAEPIPAKSYFFAQAQDLLYNCANQMLELAKGKLDEQDWQGTLEITAKIPASVKEKIEAEVKDLTDLAMAQSHAERGTPADIEEAISLAQKLDGERPLYEKAQQLIKRWQLETQDVARLEWARDLAQPGGVNQLKVAILQAEKIPNSHPRGSEAIEQINTWRNKIETIEDRPLLNQAAQQANLGNIESLQDAIAEASKISSGRALYPEAQKQIQQWDSEVQRQQDQPILDSAQTQADLGNLNDAITAAEEIRRGRTLYKEAQGKILDWRREIQRQQDQPYLDNADTQAVGGNLSSAIASAQQIREGHGLYDEAQSKIKKWTAQIQEQQDRPYLDNAESQANTGNLSSAIAQAQQIKPGRALYDDAQEKIRSWQRSLLAQQNLQSAYQLAATNTPEDLAAAIRTARKVPASSKLRPQAKDAINRWSDRLLSMAQDLSVRDIHGAIAIAKNIPPGTDAYQSAQRQIQAWQQTLTPPAPLPKKF